MNQGKRIGSARAFYLLAILVVLAVGAVATACPPGTGTPGYWKNHPEAWPVSTITIGGITYAKADAIELMQTPPKGDKTYTLFRDVVAAMLNDMVGNPIYCVADELEDANEWLAAHLVGSGVAASSADWKEAGPWHKTLDAYNNGLLCAPSRDEVENGD